MDSTTKEELIKIKNDIERLKSQAEELKKIDSIKQTYSEAAAQMGIFKEALINEAGFTEEQAFQIILKICPDGSNK